jgi:PAS domain S-box-containing protein
MMEGVFRHPTFRSAASVRIALVLLITLLGVGGYLLTSRMIDVDRDEAASNRAEVESVQTQQVLGRARAYVQGLSEVLASEPRPGQSGFARLARATAASVGLSDVLWVQQVSRSARGRYERRHGTPITRLTASGRFERAPAADEYLPATFTSRTRPELRPGVDVSGFPGLAAAIHDLATIFSVGASRPGSLGGEPGFYLLEAAAYGRGPSLRGFLVAFAPRGWFISTLQGDPRRIGISEDGRRIEGALESSAAAASFEALGRRWRVDVGLETPSGLQSTLPWLALGWPLAAALIAFGVGRTIVLRRRAERAVERIFDLSLDLLASAGTDGHFKRVNPAFERTLGYSRQELLTRPVADFVHPDDAASTREALADLRGNEVIEFECRCVRADGSTRWLEVSCRLVSGEGIVYGSARDITERKRSEDQLRRAHAMVEASRDELRLVAEEQSALRRVATLVARGVPPAELLDAVCTEVGQLLSADSTRLLRYESDGGATVLATYGDIGVQPPAGTHSALEREGSASMAALVRSLGFRSGVAAPISVEGRLWGVMAAGWKRREPPLAEAESRVTEFTELVATAIANAESRAELTASRARVAAATLEERRRVVRDLHDGAQQRLVIAVMTLKHALLELGDADGTTGGLIGEALDQAEQANSSLRELAHGIVPGALTRAGLRAGIQEVVSRTSLPVTTDVSVQRLPSAIEATAYFVVSEALTNVMKHSGAQHAEVNARVEGSVLRVEVRDDGVGGADPRKGSGFTGLRDRVEALGGTMDVASPAGSGTSLIVEIPIEGG